MTLGVTVGQNDVRVLLDMQTYRVLMARFAGARLPQRFAARSRRHALAVQPIGSGGASGARGAQGSHTGRERRRRRRREGEPRVSHGAATMAGFLVGGLGPARGAQPGPDLREDDGRRDDLMGTAYRA